MPVTILFQGSVTGIVRSYFSADATPLLCLGLRMQRRAVAWLILTYQPKLTLARQSSTNLPPREGVLILNHQHLRLRRPTSMKHLLYIIIGLAAVASLYFVYVNREQLPPNQRIQPSANITPDEWETKSDEQPPVTVMVTPIEFGKNIEVWKFDIAFDTHSGSLDDDLLKVAALIDDGGNLYKPIAWEGPGPGGHRPGRTRNPKTR